MGSPKHKELKYNYFIFSRDVKGVDIFHRFSASERQTVIVSALPRGKDDNCALNLAPKNKTIQKQQQHQQKQNKQTKHDND